IIGFEKGIILSSGSIDSVVGPNTSDNITTVNDMQGDADLDNLIPGYETNDAAVLEFDFECEQIQFISFQYVFASDGYNEYVNSEYNDVFGFFLNGVNIALLPDKVTPVSINNVNCGNPDNPEDTIGPSNCELYRNNDLDNGGGSINTEMDGLTVVLTATSQVNPGVNHIKLAIADAGDGIYDSDVLIKGESFVCAEPSESLAVVSVQPQPGEGQPDLLITSKPIQIQFNKAVADTSIDDTSNVHITSRQGDQLLHTYNSEQYSLLIDNNSDYLRPFDTIVVVLDTGIVDLSGGRLDQQYVLTFYTGAAVYPGDANNDRFVDERDILPLGMYWGKEGPPRSGSSDLTWGLKPAHVSGLSQEWSPPAAVFADADGSGVVDAWDICGITVNWGRTHSGSQSGEDNWPEMVAAFKQVTKSTVQQLYAAVIDCPESGGKAALIKMLEPLVGNDLANDLPTTFELYQNYPNPFNPSTTIKFDLPYSGHVTLSIYDIMGRKVTVLYDGQMEKGPKELTWDGTDGSGTLVSSGVYFYRLETDEGSLNEKDDAAEVGQESLTPANSRQVSRRPTLHPRHYSPKHQSMLGSSRNTATERLHRVSTWAMLAMGLPRSQTLSVESVGIPSVLLG
ncbi:MAG: choice-of-anchor L domain-containing protein, partial [Candidatus Zixiibacteriota bacterium]